MLQTLCNLIANALYSSSAIKSEDERRAAMLAVYRASTPDELEVAYSSLSMDVQVEIASQIED